MSGVGRRHVVLVETPTVRGADAVEEIVAAGHELSFVTQDLDGYGPALADRIRRAATRVVDRVDLPLDVALDGRLGTTPPDGVICRDERLLHACARYAASLGLPHEHVEVARLLEDKAAVRARLDAVLPVANPRWREVASVRELPSVLRAVGLPAVVKPARFSGWSIGVSVVRSAAALEAAVESLLAGHQRGAGAQGALVEEFVPGRLVSAELLVEEGHPHLLGFAERLPAPVGTTAELGGWFPAVFPGAGSARDLVDAVIGSLGVRRSALHIELLMTPSRPVLVEVNGRMAGHVVAQQISRALDRSVALDLVDLATGHPVRPVGEPVSVVALQHLHRARPGRVTRSLPPGAPPLPGVIDHDVQVGAGDEVPALRSNTDRYGFLLGEGVTARDARRAAAGAAAALERHLGVVDAPRPGPASRPTAGDHVLLLLRPADADAAEVELDRLLTALAVAATGVSVLVVGGDPAAVDRAHAVWSARCRGGWLQPDEGVGLPDAVAALHARSPLAAIVPSSVDLRSEAADLATGLSGETSGPVTVALVGPPSDAGGTVGIVGRSGSCTWLGRATGTTVDGAADCLQYPGDEPAELPWIGPADQGVLGLVRRTPGGEVLVGLDAATLALLDAVHLRDVLAGALLAALHDVPVDTARRTGTAVRALLTAPAGPGRVVEVVDAAELFWRPEVHELHVRLAVGDQLPPGPPRVLADAVVVAATATGARAAAGQVVRALTCRVAHEDRRHVVLLDRLGTSSYLDPAGRPVLPPQEVRLTVLTSASTGPLEAVADTVINADVFDHGAVEHHVRAVHAVQPVDRVAAVSERLLRPAAALRGLLGVPGPDLARTALFVDKAHMKRLAQGAGIRCARGLVVRRSSELHEALERHGRVVVKPRASSGSQGVRMIADQQEARAWLLETWVPGRYLVEEAVLAPMCHVDAVVQDGAVLAWDVSVYARDTLALRRGESLSSTTTDDATLRTRAGQLLQQVVRTWQVEASVLHLEAFCTPGALTFCEVAARPGGAGVSAAFRATRGLDLDHAQLALHAGVDVERLRRDPVAPCAGWTVTYAARSGRLAVLDDSAVRDRAFARSCAAQVGGPVSASAYSGSGVITHVFAEDTARQVRRLVEEAEGTVAVVVEEE